MNFGDQLPIPRTLEIPSSLQQSLSILRFSISSERKRKEKRSVSIEKRLAVAISFRDQPGCIRTFEAVIARHRDKSFRGKKFLIRGTHSAMVTVSFREDKGQDTDKSWRFASEQRKGTEIGLRRNRDMDVFVPRLTSFYLPQELENVRVKWPRDPIKGVKEDPV